MDIELLKTFLEVRKTRHFGHAAESLYLTQSAVSFRIRQLENQLGANLFTRHRNNIRLTPAGERLVPYAETLMNTWQQAKKEVAHSAQDATLSIGATALLWEAYLTPWLQILYMQRRLLKAEARIALCQSLTRQLHERELDLLITSELPRMGELENQLLGYFSLQLYFIANQKKTDNATYIRLEWGADFHRQEHRLMGSEQVPVLTTTSAYLTRQLLESIGGCAYFPTHWGTEDSPLKACPETPVIVRPLHAVWLKNSDQRTLIRQLLKIPIKNTKLQSVCINYADAD